MAKPIFIIGWPDDEPAPDFLTFEELLERDRRKGQELAEVLEATKKAGEDYHIIIYTARGVENPIFHCFHEKDFEGCGGLDAVKAAIEDYAKA